MSLGERFARSVLIADDGLGDTPIDVQALIVPKDGPFGLRGIIGRAFVLEHGIVDQRREAVGKTGRDVEHPEVTIIQANGHVLSESGALRSAVQTNVQHGPVGYADQFRLRVRVYL